MIFNIFLAIISFVVQGVASILPTITLFPSDLPAGIANIVSSAYGWNWIFPVGTIIALIGALIILGAAEFSFYAAMYVLKLIRG